MANESLDHSDGWDEPRNSSESFRTLTDTFYSSSQTTLNNDFSARNGPLNIEPARPSNHLLSGPETIDLFRNAVDTARNNLQDSLHGEDKLNNTVHLSLTIDLNRRGLEVLPEEIVQILRRDVERIVLSHNQIGALPSTFSECTNITYLNLRANRFNEFPKALFNLQKLQVLDLSRNRLIKLPEEVQNMRSLRFLSVMHNSLEDLPMSLGHLESLRLLKMSGNPLNGNLKSIIDGSDSTPSPLVTPIGENEKDALITVKIKSYLKSEALAQESGAESSESPLDTPRPVKNSSSLRFPVVPAGSSSESINEQRSPGFAKPMIPARSHYRIASGQNTSQGPGFRRPGVTPLIIGNERNRSNSEGVLQATQNARSKRMGMVPKKTSELTTLDESSANRNSFHLRGTSHGSVLRDKHSHAIRKAAGHASSNSVSPVDEQSQGTFVRRLSSIPEYRAAASPSDHYIEGAKGILFSLHLVHPYIGSLLSMTSDGMTKRSSLERVYYNASTHLERLDQELFSYEKVPFHDVHYKKQKAKNIRTACKACVVAYLQVGNLISRSSHQLVTKGDQRYIRLLLLLIYSSTVEGMNAVINLSNSPDAAKSAQLERPTIPTITEETPRLTVRSATRPRDKLASNRRFRSDTLNSLRNQNPQKPPAQPHSAVPLYINGRSRSNSRSNTLTTSAMNSVANTPRSGESFLIPGTPALPMFEGMGGSGYLEQNQDATFEKIYLGFDTAVSRGLSALPTVSSQFNRCLEDLNVSKYSNKTLTDMWTRLLHRSRHCWDMCEALRTRLSTVKLKDPEVRTSMEFWVHVTRYVNSFISLCDEIKKATETHRAHLTPLDTSRVLKPVHIHVKNATKLLRESPWSHVLTQNSPPPTAQLQSKWHGNPYLNGHFNSRLNGGSGGGGGSGSGGHHRSRGGSGSSSSPYLPTTPLSAALGPAAQATIPSSTPPTLFDRSFHGDVFQRAESLLSMPQTMLHRR